MYKPEKDIAINIRLIERLKSELVTSLADLFRCMLQGTEGKVLDALSRVVIYAYLLARRLGISYYRLDRQLEQQARFLLQENPGAEAHGDLSDFIRYVESHKS